MTFVFPFLLWERSDLDASRLAGKGPATSHPRAPYWRHVLHTLLCITFCVMGAAAFAGALPLGTVV